MNDIKTWLVAMLSLGAAVAAQAETAEPVRAGRLVKYLELPDKRQHAIRELLRLGEAGVPDLARAMRDPRPEIVRTVAEILHELGPAAAAARPALERVAGSDDERCAFAARWALRAVGEREGIALVACADRGHAQAVDIETGELRGKPIELRKKVFDCERLPGGNLLTTNWGEHDVRELDADGKVVWKHEGLGSPMDVDVLADGNLLIADMGKGVVREIDRAGKTVWEHKSPDSYNANRLPGGNTLVADLRGYVVEVDRAGKEVWKYECPSAMSAVRLPDGNTLIATWGDQVLIVTPEERVVREHKLPFGAYVARMLPDGDLLVGGSGGLIRLGPKGEVKWKQALGSVGSVELY
ncbi:MAG: PQQ-binding-like beta-propeller repeat protein [Planctomycetota bacterium]